MRASEVLQKVIGSALDVLHAFQGRNLGLAVDALSACRRLTLMDLARAWPGSLRVRAPLKRLDRLLSNSSLHAKRATLYRAMAVWLLTVDRPLILVDWSDLKHDGRWCLLRAAVPIGGRTLTVLDAVVPSKELGNGGRQRDFLRELQKLVPARSRPIVISDAGFRSDWFAALDRVGWDWIGRLRGRIHVRAHGGTCWQPCKTLFARQQSSPTDLGLHELTRKCRLPCRLVMSGKRVSKGRRSLTRKGKPSADRRHLKPAQAAREPWLLACSTGLADFNPARLVAAYRRRMQIEEGFRDLKSHKYGQGFEDSLSRKQHRIEILLLIHALATFAAWLVGVVAVTKHLDLNVVPSKSARRRYSTIRIGWETLKRGIDVCLQAIALLRPPAEIGAPTGAK